MNKKAVVVVVVAVTAAACSYASPYWTIYQMRSAIEARNADKFSQYVDYPALRESVKAQFMVTMQQKMQAPEMKNNPFAGLGQMLGLAMVNTVVDAMVSPSGVMSMMAGEKPMATPSSPARTTKPTTEDEKAAAKDAVKYDVSYRSWDLVQASALNKNGDTVTVDLRRDGLWSWKWVGIKLPE
ncbi:DUF2939 domain-containing protein [Ralstonia sp. CHL-2022]|uniref:DUF2939 domain-containing protein n=1 Tax=Ralstonia mojiangensis TaxID=2953895 RepID=UPI0021B2BD9E|nr:DUF2939 domain-containing protein [Ralstonia mojiangensis]MCT7295202.1 DUF2939 domain-containing protein [Ralstonia mojiangensis]